VVISQCVPGRDRVVTYASDGKRNFLIFLRGADFLFRVQVVGMLEEEEPPRSNDGEGGGGGGGAYSESTLSCFHQALAYFYSMGMEVLRKTLRATRWFPRTNNSSGA